MTTELELVALTMEVLKKTAEWSDSPPIVKTRS
jgi:hypothetical protein